MRQYPDELKTNLIARMLPPNNVSVPALSRETGIPTDTLYTWRRKAQQGGASQLATPVAGLSSEERFVVVLETATLTEVELGEYCRRKGLFPQQVNAWRELCKQAQEPLSSKKESCGAKRRRWRRRLRCWCSKKKSGHCGRNPRTQDRLAGAPTNDHLDR